jgi:hypothetical protein
MENLRVSVMNLFKRMKNRPNEMGEAFTPQTADMLAVGSGWKAIGYSLVATSPELVPDSVWGKKRIVLASQGDEAIAAFTAKPPWQFSLQGDSNREHWAVFSEQIDNCTIFRLPVAAKEFVEFNPEGVRTNLRFVDFIEGIDVGYEDVIEIYNFVTDKVLPAFAGFFPDPSTLWYTPSTAAVSGSGA